MSTSTAYAYKVVITTEDGYTVSIEFESSEQLSKHEQEKKAEQILSIVYEAVETGIADMEVQQPKVVHIDKTTEIDTRTNRTTTHTTKTYIKG